MANRGRWVEENLCEGTSPVGTSVYSAPSEANRRLDQLFVISVQIKHLTLSDAEFMRKARPIQKLISYLTVNTLRPH